MREPLRWVLLAVLACVRPCPAAGEADAFEVRVTDESGRPVADARISATYSDGAVAAARTRADGVALLDRVPVRLEVAAAGYGIGVRDRVPPDARTASLSLPRGHADQIVTVTASRTETAGTRSAQSVAVLSEEDMRLSAARTVDDMLRRLPGFTLFRRSGSIVAHPTAQGVSLRGVGPSGASRTLVLADGAPLNDPFGGWVYWGRIPALSIERIEVLRGGASDVYGTDALGGVIQMFRRRPAPATVAASGSLGSQESREFDFFVSHRAGPMGISLAGDLLHTAGYNQITPASRGPVDVNSRSSHRSLEAAADVEINSASRAYLIASEFSEQRGNGTPVQVNDTQIRSAVAGVTFLPGGRTEYEIRGFGLVETFDAAFSSVAADRRSETVTRTQRVPARASGVQFAARRAVWPGHLFVAGGDYSFVAGASDETAFSAGVPVSASRAEGRQDRGGFYVQDVMRLTSRLGAVAGMRLDLWKNRDAHTSVRSLISGTWQTGQFAPRGDSAITPKAGARLELTRSAALRGAVSRSFRAPTLNELYRGFRVGNVVTDGNPLLGPERATSAEIGVDWSPRAAFGMRGTLFHNSIQGGIAAVTLSATPSLIRRQRQNLGKTRARGIELEAFSQPRPQWSFDAGYLAVDSSVLSAPQSPGLQGRRVPQVPKHQGTARVVYAHRNRSYVSAMLRFSAAQFDDDQNDFRLGAYQVVDLSAGRRLDRFIEVFVACENLFDRTYAVGRTPVETIGAPRAVRGGLRFHLE